MVEILVKPMNPRKEEFGDFGCGMIVRDRVDGCGVLYNELCCCGIMCVVPIDVNFDLEGLVRN